MPMDQESRAGTYDFDRIIERRGTDSIKWGLYEDDVLPMWVADMDFASPPAVIEALKARVDHGVFGYASEPAGLRELFVERLQSLYGWPVSQDDLMFFPNVVVGFNAVCRALGRPGNGLLIQPPIYFPILRVPENATLKSRFCELTWNGSGTYEIDFEAFEREAARSRVFLFCNPHNPTGRVYTRDEVERMAEICLRHDVIVCSDEIHADFVFDGRTHTPMGSTSAEMAANSVTLFAPNKTFNLAGIPCGIAVVTNEAHREAIQAKSRDLLPHISALSFAAAVAAYQDGQPWLDALIGYLQGNRDFVTQFVKSEMPGLSMPPVEGTYLAWLDCREAVGEQPHRFFLEHGRVALNDGAAFGLGGEGFVRLNFACPRSVLEEGLTRMKRALDSR